VPCLCLLGEILGKETGGSIVEISMFYGGLIGVAPSLAFWIAVVIFAAIMLRRSGDRAERFLVAGASVNLVSSLLRIPGIAIMPWLMHEGYSMTYITSITSGYGIFCNIIGMAGTICLVYAFWVKFKTRSLSSEVLEQQHQ
jgi:hypothetical protein